MLLLKSCLLIFFLFCSYHPKSFTCQLYPSLPHRKHHLSPLAPAHPSAWDFQGSVCRLKHCLGCLYHGKDRCSHKLWRPYAWSVKGQDVQALDWALSSWCSKRCSYPWQGGGIWFSFRSLQPEPFCDSSAQVRFSQLFLSYCGNPGSLVFGNPFTQKCCSFFARTVAVRLKGSRL